MNMFNILCIGVLFLFGVYVAFREFIVTKRDELNMMFEDFFYRITIEKIDNELKNNFDYYDKKDRKELINAYYFNTRKTYKVDYEKKLLWTYNTLDHFILFVKKEKLV